MNSYITAIGVANPLHSVPQDRIASFMAKAHEMDRPEEEKLKILYRATGIRKRYSVFEDYAKQDGFSFFPNTKGLEPFPSTKARMGVYKKEALDLSIRAIAQCLDAGNVVKNELTHLITVSCTGMYAPGLGIDIVSQLGLSSNIKRTAINFMGCYAAFNALKVADALCKSEQNAKVLVVCTELCSIHFQKLKTEDNLLANALFADGSAAVVMQTKPVKGINLSPLAFHCGLEPSGEKEMAWAIGDFGFEMKLSAYVPDIIKSGIGGLIDNLMEDIGTESTKIKKYAIHPGGKKILEVIEQSLRIAKEDNKPAHEVLKNYGNMSSPTVLFVLKYIFDTLRAKDHDSNLLGIAFGPGLTLESMLLKIHFES